MKVILVWMLITVSDGYKNQGIVSTVGHFATSKDCFTVGSSLPGQGDKFKWNCVQAQVVITDK